MLNISSSFTWMYCPSILKKHFILSSTKFLFSVLFTLVCYQHSKYLKKQKQRSLLTCLLSLLWSTSSPSPWRTSDLCVCVCVCLYVSQNGYFSMCVCAWRWAFSCWGTAGSEIKLDMRGPHWIYLTIMCVHVYLGVCLMVSVYVSEWVCLYFICGNVQPCMSLHMSLLSQS